jgi:energy-coupling factor transport system permease protein
VIGKLKIKKIIQICRPVFYLGISVAILWAFYEKSGIPIITISSISITDIGVLYGLSVGMRITTMLIVIIILLMSTDQGELMAGFVGLKIPYPFVLVLILSLRFFPTLLGEFRTLQEAQSSRGLEWEKGGLVKRVKNFMPLFVPIVVRGLQIVQNLSYSVESRGFGAVENRTFYRDLKITKREKTILLVLIFVSCLLITLRLLFGFGVSFSGKF